MTNPLFFQWIKPPVTTAKLEPFQASTLANPSKSRHQRSREFASSGKPALLALALILSACDIVSTSIEAIDGDTLRLAGQRIRLNGIDAPELNQACLDKEARFWDCGKAAKAHLASLVTGKPVTCTPINTDQYGRTVATCSVEEADLGDAMVRAGLAVDYSAYSRGRYRAAEQEARDGWRGIWSGHFQQPKAWRAERRRTS